MVKAEREFFWLLTALSLPELAGIDSITSNLPKPALEGNATTQPYTYEVQGIRKIGLNVYKF